MFCSNCGKECSNEATACPNCGQPFKKTSEKSWTTALLLCLFLGVFGAHRFYTKHTGTAILLLILSLSFFGLMISGIWVLIDLISIICGKFKMADGSELCK